MSARRPPRLSTAAQICKAVAKYGLQAHITMKPDGIVEMDISKAEGQAKKAGNDDDGEIDFTAEIERNLEAMRSKKK